MSWGRLLGVMFLVSAIENDGSAIGPRGTKLIWRWIGCGVDDKLIVAVGSTSNSHGVPGLEYCYQLKVS